MPEIDNLTAADIAAVLPPDEIDLDVADVALALPRRIAHIDAAAARLALVDQVHGAWGRYLDRTPPSPPAPENLSDLVSAARQALRRRQLTVDRTNLLRRSAVLENVREELVR